MSLLTPLIDEGIPSEAYKMPTIGMEDKDLLTIANAWELESARYHSELEKVWKKNESYYYGRQTAMDMIPSDMSDSVQNQIFMGVETVVPIMTSNPPHFVVEPPEESDTSIKYANATQKVLGVLYETKNVRTVGEMLCRHMLIYRYGCWKPFWNKEENDVDVKYVRPKRLYFPKVTTELPYIMELVDFTAGAFSKKFGETKLQLFLKDRGINIPNEEIQKVSGIYTIWEIVTPQMTFWKSGTTIISKQENTDYFDFVNQDKNHFKQAKIPYIIGSCFRLGNEPVGETDLITQTIPIQDAINVANRQIINNANKTGNGQWYIDSSVMSEEEANTKITNSAGLIIYGSGVANQNMMRREAPLPLPVYIENLKFASEKAFDNIFGTHSTTRGERQSEETLGGRMLLKQADIGRIDLQVKEYERCIAELGNWFVQLMRLHYTTKRTFRSYGESGLDFVNFDPIMLESGIRIIIKPGTTLPTDEITKRNEAIQLWSLQAIDPVTLFERLKFPNPEQSAQRLQAWKMGQLAMEQQAQANAKPAGRGISPQPSGTTELNRMGARMTTGNLGNIIK